MCRGGQPWGRDGPSPMVYPSGADFPLAQWAPVIFMVSTAAAIENGPEIQFEESASDAAILPGLEGRA